MLEIAEKMLPLLAKGEAALKTALREEPEFWPEAVRTFHGPAAIFCRRDGMLLIVADYRQVLPKGFQGELLKLSNGGVALVMPANAENLGVLREFFPEFRPAPAAAAEEVFTVSGDAETMCRKIDFLTIEQFRLGRMSRYALAAPAADSPLPAGVIPVVDFPATEKPNALAPENFYSGRCFVLPEGTIYFDAARAADCLRRVKRMMRDAEMRHLTVEAVKLSPGDGSWEILCLAREMSRLGREQLLFFLSGADPLTRAAASHYGDGKVVDSGDL